MTKFRKIKKLLKEHSDYSDRRIARMAGASHVWVGKVRQSFPAYQPSLRLGRDGKERKLSLSGKSARLKALLAKLRNALKQISPKDKESRDLIFEWTKKINEEVSHFLDK